MLCVLTPPSHTSIHKYIIYICIYMYIYAYM